MTTSSTERIVYLNGAFIPESQALIPVRDKSFLYGDGAFDLTRTFHHRIFRCEDHIYRFYASLRALRIEAPMSREEMIDLTHRVLDLNRHLLGPDDDYWVGQRVSRGILKVDGDNWDRYGSTVLVECLPMPMGERAHFFRDGMEILTPSIRRTPPQALTPRAKSHNYLNLVLAAQEVQASNPNGWAVLLDMNGNLCEGQGSNIFLVRDGELLTPREQFVLAGVSRLTVIELARDLSIPVREADLDLYDAYNADEAFVTSTSLCICPVGSVNGVATEVYGPVTRALTQAYINLVGCDFVQQHLDRLPRGANGRHSPFSSEKVILPGCENVQSRSPD